MGFFKHGLVCDLDEVVVGVSEVDGSDRTDGASARDRTFQDGHAAQMEVIDDLAERRCCNQADVSRTWSGRVSLGLELLALLMEIDLLLREIQSLSSSGKRDDFHAEYLLVEAAGRFNVGDCQDDVVKAEDLHQEREQVVGALELRRIMENRGKGGRWLGRFVFLWCVPGGVKWTHPQSKKGIKIRNAA